MPRLKLPFAIPSTSHATLAPALRQKDAVNDCGWPSARLADGGEIAFVAVQVIVTLALPCAEVSVVLVAVTVTLGGEGTAAGAVYSAVVALVATIVPTVELPPSLLFTLQATFPDAPSAPVTVAVNTCAPLVGTLGAVGETFTTIFGGGGEDADPAVPAQADSKIAETHSTTKHTVGTRFRVARRAAARPVASRLFAPRMQTARQEMCQSGSACQNSAFADLLGQAGQS